MQDFPAFGCIKLRPTRYFQNPGLSEKQQRALKPGGPASVGNLAYEILMFAWSLGQVSSYRDGSCYCCSDYRSHYS